MKTSNVRSGTARLLSCCALAAVSSTSLSAQCTLQIVADIPLTMHANQPLIAASINGQAVNLMLDTGAARSMLWRSAAKELGLAMTQSNMRMYGVDGRAATSVVTIRDFGLSGAMAHNILMLASGNVDKPGAAGLLGEDVVSNWDLDMDFSAGKLRLVRPKDCKGEEVIAPWKESSYSVLSLVAPPPGSNYLWAHVQVNDRQALAMFDTGAGRTVVTTLAVQRLGLKAETAYESAGVSRGLANNGLKTSVAVFPSMSIGQETIQNVRLRIADLFGKDVEVMGGSLIPQKVLDAPDLLIGADFFLAHHAYVARSQGKMYFSYKGGPIFQQPQKPAAAAETRPDAAPPSAPPQ